MPEPTVSVAGQTRRGWRFALLAVGTLALLGACADDATATGGVSSTALELLAPVDREQANAARVALDEATWDTFAGAWSRCIDDAGQSVGSSIGKERSYLGYTANLDFLAPTTIRREGGSSHIYSAAARTLSPLAAAALERCNGLVQQAAEGESGSEVAKFVDDVDPVRVDAIHTIRGLMGSEASTLRHLSEAVRRQVKDGAWTTVVGCLTARGLHVDPSVATSPERTLDQLSAYIDGTEDPAALVMAIQEAQPRLDAYISCSEPFYESLRGTLERERARSLERNRQAYQDATAALRVIGVGQR